MLDQITHLFRLQAIFEEGSLRKAAERLNLTQPALSRSLAQLEQYFGRPLLERHARGVTPTPFGERVLSESLRMQRQWAISEAALRSGEVEGTRVMRIGAGPVWRAVMVPELLLHLQKAFPKMDFVVKNTRYSQAVTDLREGRLDVLFTGAPLEEGAAQRLRAHAFAEIADHVVARECHPIFETRGPDGLVPLERLLDYPWVIYDEIPAYAATAGNALFEQIGRDPRISVRCESLLSTMTVLQRGDFLSILPDAAARAVQSPALREVPVSLRPRRTTAQIIYRDELEDWPPLQALLDSAASI
ncbi:LysR family transcriptional regulator [Pseudooceanicola sp. HF7]|uniref:LysR family transcriptional regulator n=1 Tax=Pseudooceanicola sp. HF7 TaxID=2721560 RepID=UPI001430B755|nr:LysR family transcriptional regulator [Pseudooceanicola sp. HF7]NIZ08621.1 LysR family transcriptional regulator [Pseudooceanicola sp. HF7]